MAKYILFDTETTGNQEEDRIIQVGAMIVDTKMEELTKTSIFIETFVFGKHKGEKISDVCDSDIGYISWMQKNMDLDVDMKYTLDKIMNHI